MMAKSSHTSDIQRVQELFRPRPRLHLWLAGSLTTLMGVVNLVSAVIPSVPERMEWLDLFFPIHARTGGHLFSAISGFILLTLSVHLLRRKRVAWCLTIILLVLSIIAHLIKGLDYEESLVATTLLIQLIWTRKSFTAKSDPLSISQGIKILIYAVLFTVAYGTLGFYILDGRFKINGIPTNFGWIRAVIQTLAMFFTEDNAGLQPIGRFATFFADSIYIVGGTTITGSLLLLLTPVLLRGDPATLKDRQAARGLIDAYGRTSLARLALLSDKSYYFSPTRSSVIAYVAKGRAAIALGDPIGPDSDRLECIEGFRQFCDLNDWFPAFYETLPERLDQYHRLGFQSLQIGEDAIVNLKNFNLKGKANQNLRTAVNRLSRTGHSFKIYSPPVSRELLQQLKPVSDEWLKAKQGSEKKFSIGWFDLSYLRECYIAVVYDAHGDIIAFASLLSGYNQAQVTVDLMRHRVVVENGLMDFMFVSILEHFQKEGLDSFSFSLSPLAGVGQTSEARRIEKGLAYLFENLNQFYNFKGLHSFKQKYNPTWEPRYLIFPHIASLPEIAMGLVRADSGDRLLDYLKP